MKSQRHVFRTVSIESDQSSYMAPTSSNQLHPRGAVKKRHSSDDLYNNDDDDDEQDSSPPVNSTTKTRSGTAEEEVLDENNGSFQTKNNHRTIRSSSALLSDGRQEMNEEDPLFLHEVLILLTLEKLGEYPKDREFKFALLVMMVFDLLFQGKIILQRKSIIQGGCTLERNAIVVVDDTKTRSPILNEVFEVVAQLSTMEAKEIEEILEDLCGLSPNKSNKISKLKRRLVEYFLSRHILKQSTTRSRNRLVCLPSVVKTSYSLTNKQCKKYVHDLIARVGYTVAISHQAPQVSRGPNQTSPPLSGRSVDNGPREGILLELDDNSSSSTNNHNFSSQPASHSSPPRSSRVPTSSQPQTPHQQHFPASQQLTPSSARAHVRGPSSDTTTTTAFPMRSVLTSPSAKSDLLVSDAQMRRALTIEEHAQLLLHRDDMNSQAHVPFVVLMSMPFRNNVLFDTVLLNHDSDTRDLVGIRAAELSSADPVLLELGQATAEILHNNRIFFNKKNVHGMVICG